jgi:beta-N-acetylhexosaminidase
VIHHRRSSLGAGGVGLRRRRVGTAIALLGATSLIGACTGTTSSDVTAVGVQDPESANSAPSTTSSGGTDAASIDLDPLKNCIDTLSVEEQAGQVLWVMTSTPGNLAEAAKAGKIGGVGALEDQGGDIAEQIKSINDGPRVPMVIASDEEGGTVQRLDQVIEPLPSARDTTQKLSTAQTKTMWTKYAKDMASWASTPTSPPCSTSGSARP